MREATIDGLVPMRTFPRPAKLLGASKSADRKEIVVAVLVGKKAGDNPHIWYDPATMVAFARALKDELVAADPANKDGYEQRLATFTAVRIWTALFSGLIARVPGGTIPATACKTAVSEVGNLTLRTRPTYRAGTWSAKIRPNSASTAPAPTI